MTSFNLGLGNYLQKLRQHLKHISCLRKNLYLSDMTNFVKRKTQYTEHN